MRPTTTTKRSLHVKGARNRWVDTFLACHPALRSLLTAIYTDSHLESFKSRGARERPSLARRKTPNQALVSAGKTAETSRLLEQKVPWDRIAQFPDCSVVSQSTVKTISFIVKFFITYKKTRACVCGMYRLSAERKKYMVFGNIIVKK